MYNQSYRVLRLAPIVLILLALLVFPISFGSSNTQTVVAATTTVTVVAAGDSHTCAVIDAGGVLCWGMNRNGQLGDGTTTGRTTPVSVIGLASAVTALAAGDDHTCAIMGGGVKCWGLNTSGELGNGTIISSSVPVDVIGLASGVTAITAGANHTCAIVNGGMKCWGSNNNGQIGNGSFAKQLTPVDVYGLTTGVTSISAGGLHTCAVMNGAAKCWGYNFYGQLGDNSQSTSSMPVNVSGLTSGVTAISTGLYFSCAVMNSGARCWGDNSLGQVGNGAPSQRETTPLVVSGLSSGVSLIDGGNFSTCALTTAGGVKCWGGGGSLGDGTTTQRNTPVDVIGLSSGVSSLATGGGHSCALLPDGSLRCWGTNINGQIGDGTTINRYTPVNVMGMATPTVTPTSTATFTSTSTPTNTPTVSPTGTSTATPTLTTTVTPTGVPPNTPTLTPTPLPTYTECRLNVCIDTDKDEIWDNWESQGGGIDANGDGSIDLDLYALGARPNRRDIFVEIDWMPNTKPQIEALEDVKAAFARAPVWDEDEDGDGTQGVRPAGILPGVNLIYQLDEEVPESESVSFDEPGAGELDDVFDYRYGSNNAYRPTSTMPITYRGLLDPNRICGTTRTSAKFGLQTERQDPNCVNIIHAKAMIFRYALFVHKISAPQSSFYLGAGDMTNGDGGNKIIISNDWSWASGNIRVAQAGEFMHELGHTLGLTHGGDNDSAGSEFGCKPNYFSVMNYLYTLPLADPTRPLDYSPWASNSLNETSLIEQAGVVAPQTRRVLYGKVTFAGFWGEFKQTNQSIDWNYNGKIDASPVAADLNELGILTVGVRTKLFCPQLATRGQNLTGHDDWKSLDYSFRDWVNYPYGNTNLIISAKTVAAFGSTLDEPTLDQFQSLASVVDYDSDGYPNSIDTCPAIANLDQRIPAGVECGISFRSTILLPLIGK